MTKRPTALHSSLYLLYHKHTVTAPLRAVTQIWRLITNTFIIDKPSIRLVIYITYIHTYFIALERETFSFDPAGMVYMIMFITAGLNALALFTGPGFYGAFSSVWGHFVFLACLALTFSKHSIRQIIFGWLPASSGSGSSLSLHPAR